MKRSVMERDRWRKKGVAKDTGSSNQSYLQT